MRVLAALVLVVMMITPHPRPVTGTQDYQLPYRGPELHDCRRWAYTDAFAICAWLGNLDRPPVWMR